MGPTLTNTTLETQLTRWTLRSRWYHFIGRKHCVHGRSGWRCIRRYSNRQPSQRRYRRFLGCSSGRRERGGYCVRGIRWGGRSRCDRFYGRKGLCMGCEHAEGQEHIRTRGKLWLFLPVDEYSAEEPIGTCYVLGPTPCPQVALGCLRIGR